MLDDEKVGIFSKAFQIYLEWAKEAIPGFYSLLVTIQEELNASSSVNALLELVLNPENFYRALADHCGSPIVAESYLYLMVSSFINFFKLPLSAVDLIKVARKGKWDEWKSMITETANFLLRKIKI